MACVDEPRWTVVDAAAVATEGDLENDDVALRLLLGLRE